MLCVELLIPIFNFDFIFLRQRSLSPILNIGGNSASHDCRHRCINRRTENYEPSGWENRNRSLTTDGSTITITITVNKNR